MDDAHGDQSPATTPAGSKPAVVLTVLVLAVAAAVGWLWFRVEGVADDVGQLQSQNALTGTDEADSAAETDEEDDGLTVVRSGKGGFEVTLPDGWGPLLKPTDSDWLIMHSSQQPDLDSASPVEVTETEGYGTDAISLFSIILSDSEFAPPQGVATAFSIGKAEQKLSGKKYVYVYQEDTTIGIGYLRLAGDRDYEYVFTLKDGRELHVNYHVFGSDPRNLVETVDGIVQSIKVL